MKKLLSIILTVLFVVSRSACGKDSKDSNTTSGPSVDSNTIEIVNKAFGTTEDLLKSAKALKYKNNCVVSVTVDDVTTAVRASSAVEYIDGENGRVFATNGEVKSGETSASMSLYSDGKDTYGYKAGTTYQLVGNGVGDYTNGEFAKIKVWNTSSLKPLNTTIVNTASGGYGFVIDYDFNDASFNFNEFLKDVDNFDAEALKDIQFTVTGVTASGIIDSEGRLTSEAVKLVYEYTMEVEVPKTDVDPDNSGVNTTEIVSKTVKNEISIELTFNYDLTEVTVPDGMTVGSTDEDGEQVKKPTEISVSDFEKLSASAEADK